MKKYLNFFGVLLGLSMTMISFVSAEDFYQQTGTTYQDNNVQGATSYYQGSENYTSYNSAGPNSNCCVPGSSNSGNIGGEVSNAVLGDVTGNVVSPTVTTSGGGGGGGGVFAQYNGVGTVTPYMGQVDMGTPTYDGTGGGEFPGSTTTPYIPNTGLGDESYTFYGLLLLLLLLVEIPLLLYKK